jgi:hypothetical protein
MAINHPGKTLFLQIMRRMVYITLLISYSSCFLGTSEKITLQANQQPTISYEDFLKEVKAKREKLKDQPLTDAKKYFFTLINDKIPAYWAGTPWDFNGVTRKPGEGKIACGYFITNTLTDLGFEIERVKLAQAASSVLIKATCTNIKNYNDFDDLTAYLNKADNYSVFIVGLDFHTGYITKEKNDCYFIHSNYIGSKGVTKEKIQDSKALNASKTWMIGSISAHDDFIKNWCR